MIDKKEIIGFTLLSLLVNFLLMLVKILTGIVGNSYALIADGIESASDIVVSLITWLGFSLSLRPPDKAHPYGHGKIESLAGMFSGSALIIAAIVIAIQSIHEILTPHKSPEWFTLPVLIAVVIVKQMLARKILKYSESIDSRAVEGDAWHHHSDAITSGAAALGISIALMGGPSYASADDWAALFACSLIIYNGGKILIRSFHENIDGGVDNALEQSIRETTHSVDGVLGTEKCLIRKSGTFFFVEIHVEVDPELSVFMGHEIAHHVKSKLGDQFPALQDAVIHIEPYEAEEK